MAKLVTPGEEYLESYLEACRGFKAQCVTLFSLHDPDAFEEWRHTLFKRFEDQRLGVGLKEGYVPSTTLWLVERGEFVGAGNIRHHLNAALERFGGHIGYAVRWDKWGMGYGTVQLGLLLEHAAKLGIGRVLITCDEGNAASARVIEKNGGVYQDTIENVVDGVVRFTRRYWV